MSLDEDIEELKKDHEKEEEEQREKLEEEEEQQPNKINTLLYLQVRNHLKIKIILESLG